MAFVGPLREFRRLKTRVRELERRYLQPHAPVTGLSLTRKQVSTVHLDINAFVVLTHAAMEQFLEQLAEWLLCRVVDAWTLKQRTSQSTACLLAGTSLPSAQRSFDRIRLGLTAAKAAHSRYLREANHGIGEEYLAKMFSPLGIDIPTDMVLLASLDNLVRFRGERAHRSGTGVTRVSDPKDIQGWVRDCEALVEKLTHAVASAGQFR